MTFAYFWFWTPRNILRKLWCARLQIGVEGVKGEEGTFTYLPAFFLPLVFENSSQSFIEYSTDFWIWPLCTFTDRISETRGSIRFSACSDIKKWLLNWYHFTLLIFIKLNENYGNLNWVDTFFFGSVYKHAGHTRKTSGISKAAEDNCGKGVGNFYLS